MAAWHRSWKADVVLRLGGAVLWSVAYLAISRVVAMHIPQRGADVLAYGLAAIGFLCASAGSSMILMGAHLFDQVEISARWRRSSDATPKGRQRPGTGGSR